MDKKLTLQGLNKEIEFLQEKMSDIMEMMAKLHADMSKSRYPQPTVGQAPVPLPGMPQAFNPYAVPSYNRAIQPPFSQMASNHKSIFMVQPYPGSHVKSYTGELDGELDIEVITPEGNTMKFCHRLAVSEKFPLKASSALAHISTDNKVDLSIYLYGLVDLNGFSRVLVFDYIRYPMNKLFMNETGAPYTLFNSLTTLVKSRGNNNTIRINDKTVSEIRFFRDSEDSADFYSHGNFQNIRVRLEYFPIGGPAYGYYM